MAAALAVGWPDRITRIAMPASPPRLGKTSAPSFKQAQRDWYPLVYGNRARCQRRRT
ncbi:hypothetical protein [Neorhizobium vignae]|uniref:hypothetical protein n=1 Tax=Neorhizobium vignae TaxID=690585 RepID=UPI003137955A